MEIKEITRTFNYSVGVILHAKHRNFIKRSIWKYLIASFIMAVGLKGYLIETDTSLVKLSLLIFISIAVISYILIIISSFIIARKKREESMTITLRENEIHVYYMHKGIREIKEWDWIKSFQELNNVYYLDLDVWPRNVIMMSKSKFTEIEKETLFEFLRKNGKSNI